MPNRLLTYLGSGFFLLVGAYVSLVIGTVYLASLQTDLLSSVSDTEASIGTLESKYYTAIDQISATDPATLGLATPAGKEYVRAADSLTLTLMAN